jgi:hypothetical protein
MMFPALPRSNVGDDLPAHNAAEGTHNEIDQNLLHVDLPANARWVNEISEEAVLSGDAPLASRDEAIDEEQDDCANHTADEAGGFSCLVPPDGLTEIGCNEGADDSQNGRQDKALRFRLITRHDQFSNDSNDKADNDCPKDAHCTAPALTGIDRDSATTSGKTGLIQIKGSTTP